MESRDGTIATFSLPGVVPVPSSVSVPPHILGPALVLETVPPLPLFLDPNDTEEENYFLDLKTKVPSDDLECSSVITSTLNNPANAMTTTSPNHAPVSATDPGEVKTSEPPTAMAAPIPSSPSPGETTLKTHLV